VCDSWCATWDKVVYFRGLKQWRRGLVMHGATACLYAPLQNSSIEQWRVMVIITGCSRL